MTKEKFKAFHDERWQELDIDIKIKAIAAIRTASFPEDIEKIKEVYAKDPISWATPYHFQWGMWIRNKIRELTEIYDDQLPSGNWDDYYVAAVEAAFGLREIQ